MPQDEAQDGANKLFGLNRLDLKASLCCQIQTIQTTLSLWNSKINITKNDKGERFFIENVLDPIVACQNYLNLDENYLTKFRDEQKTLKLIDLGCGGGFVGIFWTLWLNKIYPTMSVQTILLDAQRKRTSFCTEAVRVAGLTHSIHCQHARAETPSPNLLAQFDLVVSRATWDFTTFVKMARPFAKTGARLVSFEGPSGLAAMKTSRATLLEYQVLPTEHPRFLGVMQI